MRSDNIQSPSGPVEGPQGNFLDGIASCSNTREAPAKVRNEAAQTHLLMSAWLGQLVSNQRDFQRWVKRELAETQQNVEQEARLEELRMRWQELREAFQLELKRVQELLTQTQDPSTRHFTIREGKSREEALFVRTHRVMEKPEPSICPPEAREDWRSRTAYISMTADAFPKNADGETMKGGTKAV